jgi:hypothetical protein
MARALVAATAVPGGGLVLEDTAVAAELTDGNSFVWGPRRRLYVANGDATDLTVTLQTPATVGLSGLAVADATVTVPAGKSLLLRPLGTEYRRPDGAVWMDYSGAAASVTVAVLDES